MRVEIIAGTGDFGRVYQIKPDGSYSLMFELDSAQVFKLIGNKKGFFLISNNTALLTEVDGSLNRSGTYFSDIFDAKIKAKLGRITWMSESRKPGGISFFVRMGNSNIPDGTWTAWSPPYTEAENSHINISGYRYFQIKVGFIASSPDENPVLKGYQIYYLQANLKPRVNQIKINKPKVTRKTGKTTDRQERKHLVVSWKAEDPNNDRLNFNIYVKKINAKNWLLIQKNFEKKTFKLFSELYDDGKYVLRVVVDDSKDNAPSLAKSGTHVSFPFTIDSTAPSVSDFKIDESQVRFSVIDVTSPVSEVTYSFDGIDWYPLFPEDLINDSKAENFRFKLRELKQHQVLFIKVVDEFGNFKVFQKDI